MRIEAGGVPHQARIEELRGEYGEQYDRTEGDGADAGLDGRHGTELHQRAQQRFHEDVDHRPAADPGDDVVEARALDQPERRARLGGEQHRRQQHDAEPDQLEQRHQDAGKKHQQRQRIHMRGKQFLDAAQDRARLA